MEIPRSVSNRVFAAESVDGDAIGNRRKDYCEIFRISRSSSIPVLRIPFVGREESRLHFDVRSSGFDYAEVFGNVGGAAFAASFQDILAQYSGGASFLSDDESRSSVESEFNASGSEQSRRNMEKTVLTENTVSSFSQAPGHGFSFYVPMADEDKQQQEHLHVSVSQEHFKPFMTISDISLRTKPSKLPPPSRPPPGVVILKRESERLDSESKFPENYSVETTADEKIVDSHEWDFFGISSMHMEEKLNQSEEEVLRSDGKSTPEESQKLGVEECLRENEKRKSEAVIVVDHSVVSGSQNVWGNLHLSGENKAKGKLDEDKMKVHEQDEDKREHDNNPSSIVGMIPSAVDGSSELGSVHTGEDDSTICSMKTSKDKNVKTTTVKGHEAEIPVSESVMENDYKRKVEEEKEREREREKDRISSIETRLRAERVACRNDAEKSQNTESVKYVDSRYSSLPSDLHYQGAGASRNFRHSSSSFHDGAKLESSQQNKARLDRSQRTADRVANALAENNKRDLIAEKEAEERNNFAEALDAQFKRWSSGKEGNLRAQLSTLQYILGPESGWQPVPLTEIVASAAVKKAFRKAILCVHPDKLQQRGATVQHKYICDKVFHLLKEAWNKFIYMES